LISPRGHYNAYVSQATKDVRGGQGTFVDVFERIESFFRRLEVYTGAPPTNEMIDTLIRIMVEVLSILGIATKEIKQGRMSERFSTSMSPLAERCSEKFVKKLIGKNDMEDVLKKLDKLTQEEARMAAVQNLKATHTVDDRVSTVGNTLVTINNRVSGVDSRVAGVDGRVATATHAIDEGVLAVDDKVASVDNKVAEVIDGA
jgi:hypothetical protein